MSFPFRCPLCHAERMAYEAIKDRRVRCPECSQMVHVDAASWKWDDMQRDTQLSLPTLGLDTTLISDLQEFDPYHEWLGIPTSKRPTNHYELLGLNLFEGDEHVINDATDRQVAQIKSLATVQHGQKAQQLLVELNKASACLLDPEKKADYDRELRSELGLEPEMPQPPRPPASSQGTDERESLDEPPVVRQPGTGTIAGFDPVRLDDAPPPPTGYDSADVDSNGEPPVIAQTAGPPQTPRDQSPRMPTVSFNKPSSDRESEMDMTPMVDVTFLLLIFFMVTASFTLQKSIETPAQEQDEPSTNVQQMDDFEDNVDYVVVRVDEFNTYRVIYAGWSEDREAPSPHELLRLLRRAREGTELEGRIIRPTKLVVAAHGDAHHNTVVKAIDAGSDVGMEQVQTVLAEEDDYY